MKAVYESSKPYSQIGYWDVNAGMPVYCEERVLESGVIISPERVGTGVILPDSEMERNRSYLFSEGKKHNQLTLTDPKKILNMRAYISGMEQFTEVFCEGDPVEELSNMDPVENELSEDLEHDLEDPEYGTYNDWDEKMAERLKH